MSGIRVNSFVNQAVPSISPDIKKDGEKNTSNWKAYAAAGTAIAGIAFAAGRAWSASTMNSDVPELKETADKVRDIVVGLLADKEITDDEIIKAVATFDQQINPMLDIFPDASSVEIVLLAASEGIWEETVLYADETNELIEQVFEKSCKELNLNCKELMQTLSNKFNDSTINEDTRWFIDHNRKDPCQYPYCENWTPPETGDSAKVIPGKKTQTPGLAVTECPHNDCKKDI